MEEHGGLNLYGFSGNDGVNRWDYLGQYALMSPFDFRLRLWSGNDGKDGTMKLPPIQSLPYGKIPPGIITDPLEIQRFIAAVMKEIERSYNDGTSKDPGLVGPSAPNKTDDCAKRKAALQNRIKAAVDIKTDIQSSQARINQGWTAFRDGVDNHATAIAGAAGGAAGIGEFLAGGANMRVAGDTLQAVGLITFAVQFGDQLGTTIGQGVYGDPGYGSSLMELWRQGAVFTGSAQVGLAIAKNPTSITLAAGGALAAGGVVIDWWQTTQLDKQAYQQWNAEINLLQQKQQWFPGAVDRLINDIQSYLNDCGGN
jgi:hypothetical protein